MAQKVLFKRKTSQQIDELPIEDGSLIYNVENGKTYMDYGNNRIQTGGNAETMIAITDNEPTDEDIKLWIPTSVSNTKASEVVDSLDGNESNLAPSVRAVNEALLDTYSTEEVKTNKVWIDGKPVYRKVINDTTNRAIGSYSIPHGITNLDTLVYKSVTMYQNSTIAFDGSATSALSSSENTGSYLNGANISIRTSWEIIKTIIILEYTKTTD